MEVGQRFWRETGGDTTVTDKEALPPFYTEGWNGNIYLVAHGNVSIDGPTIVTLIPVGHRLTWAGTPTRVVSPTPGRAEGRPFGPDTAA